ncbi:hypothetical protein [Falsiroseomonas sp. HW251]|uniref:hypothetical protein n=1 Tax=Falsiroseomonas sp. HW251 TaxID=3390998 RepID=UPI003D321085
MAALSGLKWTALRAEWELGASSTRALAAKYGVSEKAIRKRAADTRDPWHRYRAAADRARERGREATLLVLARARSAAKVRTDPASVATRRAALEDEAAEMIAAANLSHLAVSDMLHEMFETICVLLHGALEDGDEDAKPKCSAAAAASRAPSWRWRSWGSPSRRSSGRRSAQRTLAGLVAMARLSNPGHPRRRRT